MVCYSGAIKPLLAFLADFRGEKDNYDLAKVRNDIMDSVFGREEELAVIENNEDSSDIPTPRESDRFRFCVSTLTHGSAPL